MESGDSSAETVALIDRWREGSPREQEQALDALFELLHEDIRARVARVHRRRAGVITIEVTEGVHEVYMLLRNQRRIPANPEELLKLVGYLFKRHPSLPTYVRHGTLKELE